MTEIILFEQNKAMDAARTRKDIVTALMRNDILRDGIDFGAIPGSSKPTLLKPGAERLCAAFGLDPRYRPLTVIEDWDKPLFHYRYECSLVHIDSGLELATGVGSCNSMEKKYRYRKAELVCPSCGQPAITKSKKEYGGGWFCFAKKGGCGAKFPKGAEEIESQEQGDVPNEDIYSLVNTIDKMAQKRALIAATLVGANASEFFTQDVEDLPGFGEIIEGSVVVLPATTKPAPEKPTTTTNSKSETAEPLSVDAVAHAADFMYDAFPHAKNDVAKCLKDGILKATDTERVALAKLIVHRAFRDYMLNENDVKQALGTELGLDTPYSLRDWVEADYALDRAWKAIQDYDALLKQQPARGKNPLLETMKGG